MPVGIQVGLPVYIFNTVALANGRSSIYALPVRANQTTVQLIYGTTPSAVSISVDVSNDGTNWESIATSTNTDGEILTFNTSALFISINVVSHTGGDTITAIAVSKTGVIGSTDFVTGPSSVTNGSLALFDGATGKIIKELEFPSDDTKFLNGIGEFAVPSGGGGSIPFTLSAGDILAKSATGPYIQAINVAGGPLALISGTISSPTYAGNGAIEIINAAGYIASFDGQDGEQIIVYSATGQRGIGTSVADAFGLFAANGNNIINVYSDGHADISGISYPVIDGSAGQVIKTNGSGVLSFVDPTSFDPTADITFTGIDAFTGHPLTLADSLQIGTAPFASIGAIRIPTGTYNIIQARNATDDGDVDVLAQFAGGWVLGDYSNGASPILFADYSDGFQFSGAHLTISDVLYGNGDGHVESAPVISGQSGKNLFISASSGVDDGMTTVNGGSLNLVTGAGFNGGTDGRLTINNTPGITAGPFIVITSITVTNGIVTGLTGS